MFFLLPQSAGPDGPKTTAACRRAFIGIEEKEGWPQGQPSFF